MAKMRLLSLRIRKRSYQNNAYEAPAQALWCPQTAFLSKQVPTIVAGRRRDAQTIEIL